MPIVLRLSHGQVVPLHSGTVIRIGAASTCQIRLDHPDILPQHLALKLEGDQVRLAAVADAGVYVNDRPVSKALLRVNDRIRVATFEATLESSGAYSLEGKVLDGYRIESCLGRGAMGTVYRATQLSLDRTVALKILADHATEDHAFVQAFLKEARAIAKLNHPRVVQVYDAGQCDGKFYFSMEFLSGGTVADLLTREERLPMERALTIALDAADALVWAEEQEIVHRDIKPANLLLTEDGAVKVGDLGIALDTTQRTAQDATRKAGSPKYMAPEQALGKPVDRRADIYGLGSTIFHMLAGRPPFEGQSMADLMRAKLAEEAPRLDEFMAIVPPQINRLVAKSLAREAEDRFSTCAEMRDAIESALQSLSQQQEPQENKRIHRTLKRKRTLERLSLFASVVIIVAAAVWATRPKDPSVQQPPPTTTDVDVGANKPKTPQQDSTHSSADSSDTQLAELRDIRRRWQKGLLTDDAALLQYNRFRTLHPGVHRKTVDAFHAEVQTEIVQAEKKVVEQEVAKRIMPLIDRGEFRQAATHIASIREKYRHGSAPVDKATDKIRTKVGLLIDESFAVVSQLVDEGKLSSALDELDALASLVPFEFRSKVDDRREEIDAMVTTFSIRERQLREIEGDVWVALSLGEADDAEALARSVPPVAPLSAVDSLISDRRSEMIGDVERAVRTWKRLRKELKDLQKRRKAFVFAFAPDCQEKFARSKFRAYVGALGESRVTVHRSRGVRQRTFDVLDLSDEVLLTLLDSTESPPAEISQGLATLLLLSRGPQRARPLLTSPRLTGEDRASNLHKLDGGEENYLTRVLFGVRRQYEAAATHSTPAPVESQRRTTEALVQALVRVITSYREDPAYGEHRAEFSSLFLKSHIAHARAYGVETLFSGEVTRSTNDSVDVFYDFLSKEQLADFTKTTPDTSTRITDEGLELSGEVRLLRGIPFKRYLSVTLDVPAGGYHLNAPNINLALWTHDGDLVSAGRGQSAARPKQSPGDYFVFAIGFKPSSISRSHLRVRGLSTSVPMPANAFMGGERGTKLLTYPTDECIWASSVQGKTQGDQRLAVDMSPQSLTWTVNGEAIPITDSREADRFKSRAFYSGSFTLFTNGQRVVFRSLRIGATLSSEWIEEEFERHAHAALETIDPVGTAEE